METTLQMVQADADRDYTSEDMRTLLIRNLVPQMNSDSELTVRMIAADAEKGLLSVEVEEYFSYPGGKEGSIQMTMGMEKKRRKGKKKWQCRR